MTRAKAIKAIYKLLNYGGLPRAIEIYNYISCNGEIKVTNVMICKYFGKNVITLTSKEV